MNAKMRQVREKAKRKGIIFIANKFDDCPIAEAIGVIGKQRHRDLLAKADANGWNAERLDSEIRCLADEVADVVADEVASSEASE